MKTLWLLVLTVMSGFGSAQAILRPQLKLRVGKYDYCRFNRLVSESIISEDSLKVKTLFKIADGEWEMGISHSRHSLREDTVDSYRVCMRLDNGKAKSTAVAVSLDFTDWEREGYLLMPATAYNGNRFESRRIRYSPKLNDNRDMGANCPIIISDVPRLSVNGGPSRIQERSGSLAFPFIGMFHDRQAVAITFPYRNDYGDLGIDFEELRDKGCTISLFSPVVREKYKYEIADNMVASDDRPVNFTPGDSIVFEFQLHRRPAKDVNGLFDLFFDLRMKNSNDKTDEIFPFSEAYEVIEQKFNTQNFVSSPGYYSVGMRENFLQDWQIGWTGGMITTYPLLYSDNKETINNVIANFEWLFPDGISPSGFFWDSGEGGDKWYGGDIRREQTANWHLVRKSGDALYFIMKQFALMRTKGISVRDSWNEGARRVANAFVTLFNRYGQFGQFIDSRTGEIVVGGSTSGAIVPAALVLAAEHYGEPVYLEVAKKSARDMYDRYISQGISCGGPGDAMQNPDSESWYAIIDSFMTLYDATGEMQWLEFAETAAKQFSTWVMSYNYEFPESTLFGQLDMKTVGAVFANTQNKHGSPGICTHSGEALLRLFRATGDDRYADLLSQISKSISGFMSHSDRVVAGMPPGWINERVSTTDWFEGIGEINPGSTWAETAMLLSAAELPGVYIDIEGKRFHIFDNLEGRWSKNGKLILTNQTRYKADVRIMAEKSADKNKRLSISDHIIGKKVNIPPGKSVTIDPEKFLRKQQ